MQLILFHLSLYRPSIQRALMQTNVIYQIITKHITSTLLSISHLVCRALCSVTSLLL